MNASRQKVYMIDKARLVHGRKVLIFAMLI